MHIIIMNNPNFVFWHTAPLHTPPHPLSTPQKKPISYFIQIVEKRMKNEIKTLADFFLRVIVRIHRKLTKLWTKPIITKKYRIFFSPVFPSIQNVLGVCRSLTRKRPKISFVATRRNISNSFSVQHKYSQKTKLLDDYTQTATSFKFRMTAYVWKKQL